MAKPAKGVSYTPPASQVDLEKRLADDFRTDVESTSPEQTNQFAVEDNDTSAYVGVSEEYRTYANDTEKPHAFTGVEGEAVKVQLEGANTEAAEDEDEDDSADDADSGGDSGDSGDGSSSPTPVVQAPVSNV